MEVAVVMGGVWTCGEGLMIGEGVGDGGWVRMAGVRMAGGGAAGGGGGRGEGGSRGSCWGGVEARWVEDESSDGGRAWVMADNVEARGAREGGWF